MSACFVWQCKSGQCPCLAMRMRALSLRIAPCNEGIAHYNTDGGQQPATNNQQQPATSQNQCAGHVVANQFPIGNGAFLPANQHRPNTDEVQCGQYRQHIHLKILPLARYHNRQWAQKIDRSIDRSNDRLTSAMLRCMIRYDRK